MWSKFLFPFFFFGKIENVEFENLSDIVYECKPTINETLMIISQFIFLKMGRSIQWRG